MSRRYISGSTYGDLSDAEVSHEVTVHSTSLMEASDMLLYLLREHHPEKAKPHVQEFEPQIGQKKRRK